MNLVLGQIILCPLLLDIEFEILISAYPSISIVSGVSPSVLGLILIESNSLLVIQIKVTP